MNEIQTYSNEQLELARFAKALSHPARVMILELLSHQSCCYSGDIADELPIARSTLSQHLKELKASGLIKGEVNPPKIKYCLDREKWDTARQAFGSLFIKDSSNQ